MTYEYRCTKCMSHFDVIKSVKDIDVNEFCPTCESPSERLFIPQRVFFSGTRVEHAEYNPGLGAVVKNKRHREDLAKRKGLVEVGSDFKSAESMNQYFDSSREEKIKKRWAEE